MAKEGHELLDKRKVVSEGGKKDSSARDDFGKGGIEEAAKKGAKKRDNYGKGELMEVVDSVPLLAKLPVFFIAQESLS